MKLNHFIFIFIGIGIVFFAINVYIKQAYTASEQQEDTRPSIQRTFPTDSIEDSDNDTRPNWLEEILGTDPHKKETAEELADIVYIPTSPAEVSSPHAARNAEAYVSSISRSLGEYIVPTISKRGYLNPEEIEQLGNVLNESIESFALTDYSPAFTIVPDSPQARETFIDQYNDLLYGIAFFNESTIAAGLADDLLRFIANTAQELEVPQPVAEPYADLALHFEALARTAEDRPDLLNSTSIGRAIAFSFYVIFEKIQTIDSLLGIER